MTEILTELNLNNGSNYKLDVLKKHKDNQLFQRLLKMTYDKVSYSYGITMKNVEYTPGALAPIVTLLDALDILEESYATRDITGNSALYTLARMLEAMTEADAKIIELVLGRDLKVGIGRTSINKVWKDLIIKPPYMRCGIYSKKTTQKISFPAIVQLKADGRYVAITVDNGDVTFTSRSGEEQEFPFLLSRMQTFPNGVYVGELLVRGVTNRAEANGMINSSEPPHDLIYVQLWDYLTLSEYTRPKDKKDKIPYARRLFRLNEVIRGASAENISVIPTYEVQDINQALQITSAWMTAGFEGAILKDKNNTFIDHTSPTQLKLKVVIEMDVRCTGFTEGTKGTSREKTFGAMTYSTDDGMIQGQTSGFTDKQLELFNATRKEWVGKIFALEGNDITRSRSNEFYAVSHPRFIEFRDDKTTTDTLERVLELKQSAMELSDENL